MKLMQIFSSSISEHRGFPSSKPEVSSLFWHQGPVSWKTFFPWMGVGIVSGWFKHMTLTVHFVSTIIASGGEGGGREWDGWMASPAQWAWVWANLGDGEGQGSLQSMGSQRVGHNWGTKLQQREGFTSLTRLLQDIEEKLLKFGKSKWEQRGSHHHHKNC